MVESNENNHDRGLHIVVINPVNGKLELAVAFDTHETEQAFDQFIK